MVAQPKLMTVDEFEQFLTLPENRDRYFELVHGEIVEKPMPTEEHGVIALKIGSKLLIFVEMKGVGRVGVEVRNRTPSDEHNTRQPDISYFSNSERPLVRKGAVSQMPDLAVEIKSPDDSYKEMREKADYYLANGARMVWLVYPEKQLVEAHTPDDFDILTLSDILGGGEVLPGFMLPVRDIFPQ
jgi:Uma2 family endonuclease